MSIFECINKYQNYQHEQLGDMDEEALMTKLLTNYNIDKEYLRHVQTLGEIDDLCEQFYNYYIENTLSIHLHDKLLEYDEET
jgi:hypothetical protein